MAAANQAELYTIQLIKELATAHYRQPISVLVYNDVSSHFSKKTAAIFTSPSGTLVSQPLATATNPPAPFNNSSSDVNYGAAASREPQSRGNTSGVRLLTIKSPHRMRYSALEALLEALEDVIGRELAGMPVEDTKHYAIAGNGFF